MKPGHLVRGGLLLLGLTFSVRAAESPAAASKEPDPLYSAARELFDQVATPDVKAQFEFPSKEQWDEFLGKLQQALDGDSLDGLADYAPQARAALGALRTLGADDELADWLEQRLDEVEGAQQAKALPPAQPRPPVMTPKPGNRAPVSALATMPYYDLWLARVRERPLPSRAPTLMPTLRRAFASEGVPAEFAWLAEAESSLNPSARSPAGAKGLFQLMPDTAHRFGLGTFMPDERVNPEKSARAAARYLRALHEKFGDWPLALAAYNAGEGRVSRALAARHARDFAGVAEALPAETRMYVPKVCALVSVRAGWPAGVR
jgi:membrane-bound lytic murein transglycosylase D